MQQKVNIYTGFSNHGGSTLFFIDLTNRLNEVGYDVTLYGPDDYHLDKCKSGKLTNTLDLNQEDIIIISHLLPDMGRINAKLKILSCHEMDHNPLKQLDCNDFDLIQYVSEHQRIWQDIDHPYKIIPPFVDRIEPNIIDGRNIAGIIGHVHEHKQIHLAIEMALRDGCDQVLIYGGLGNLDYFYNSVFPLLDGEKVKYCGACYQKQEMFDSFDVLYSASKSETYSYVVSEALFAGKKVVVPDGCEYLNCRREFDNEKLMSEWIEVLKGD